MSHFSTPRCTCLYELENKLPRTKHCFVACSAQLEILEARERNDQLLLKAMKHVQDKNRKKI